MITEFSFFYCSCAAAAADQIRAAAVATIIRAATAATSSCGIFFSPACAETTAASNTSTYPESPAFIRALFLFARKTAL